MVAMQNAMWHDVTQLDVSCELLEQLLALGHCGCMIVTSQLAEDEWAQHGHQVALTLTERVVGKKGGI